MDEIKEVNAIENTEIAEVEPVELATTVKHDGVLYDKKSYKLAQILANSDMIPDSYKGKMANVLIALDYASRMNCSPFMVMQNLYVVHGKPSWSGQACSMIVNGCGLFDNVDLVYVGKEGADDYGAYVEAARKSDGKRIKGTTVTMKMAKGEGWTKNSKWQTMTQQMLGYRAYSFFARLYCPNALSGFATEGEVEDSMTSRSMTVDNPFADDGK